MSFQARQLGKGEREKGIKLARMSLIVRWPIVITYELAIFGLLASEQNKTHASQVAIKTLVQKGKPW